MPFIGNKPTSVPLTSSDITDGIITTTKIADANVTNPKLTSGSQQNFRNIIINGDMSIAQRGTVTGIITNSYTLDRWITEGDDATLTVSQDTSVPSAQGFGKSLKIAVTTANASVAAADEQKIGQRIEGQLLQQLLYGTSSAKSFTLSFWVKSNITGTYGMQFQNDDNNKVQTATYSISSADTWEKKTITISGDTASGFDNDANRSFRVLWWLAAGSNFTSNNASSGAWIARSSNLDSIAYGHAVNVTSSTSNTFYITGVQLEAGTTASDFEFLPADVNLARCQRYYYEHAKGADKNIGNTAYYTSIYIMTVVFFPTTMRAAPTMINAIVADAYKVFVNGGFDAFNGYNVGIQNPTPNSTGMDCNANISGTAGHIGRALTRTSDGLLAFSAEL